MTSSPHPLKRSAALSQAWPIILANASTPFLGLTDTAVLGHGAEALDLAALALGTLVFNFLYWSFGFLRMATTGFVAQAAGVGTRGALAVALFRPLLVGSLVGVVLVLTQPLYSRFAFELLSAEPAAERVAAGYVGARIGGAPLHLAGLAGMGLLIGLRRSKALLAVQLFTNGLNIGLDVFFVTQLNWGARGVGWGTAIAEGLGGLLCLSIVWLELRRRKESWPGWARIVEREGLLLTLSANRDILLRTWTLIFGFSYFVDRGARFGTTVLAANHLLLQLISFSAFFLDGFAHVAEERVGYAWGRKRLAEFDRAVRVTSELAFGAAVLLAGGIALFGWAAIALLTDLEAVRHQAMGYVPQAACYVFLSVAAFQLDGVFIGASATGAMRNMAIISVLVFVGLSELLTKSFENDGLWWAFVGYVVARGATLLMALRRLRVRLLVESNAPQERRPV